MVNPPPSSQSTPIFPPVETNTLPQDLLLEILPRLPVKSLVRFQAVHTSWQSLFQNPNFISAHFGRSSLLSPRKVLLNVEFPESEEDATFVLSGDTLDAVDTSEISNLMSEEMYFLGSCCGVFCVCDVMWEKFFLWNPATRENGLPALCAGVEEKEQLPAPRAEEKARDPTSVLEDDEPLVSHAKDRLMVQGFNQGVTPRTDSQGMAPRAEIQEVVPHDEAGETTPLVEEQVSALCAKEKATAPRTESGPPFATSFDEHPLPGLKLLERPSHVSGPLWGQDVDCAITDCGSEVTPDALEAFSPKLRGGTAS